MLLNVLAIRKIAVAKGCTVQRTVTLKQRPFVQIYDGKGRAIDGAKTGNGFSLAQAKRVLEAMPDAAAKRPFGEQESENLQTPPAFSDSATLPSN